MKKLFSIVTGLLLISSMFSNRAIALTWTIEYSPSSLTNTDVVATVTGFDEPGTVILNNGGSPIYTFINNGSFDFELSGDTTTATANSVVTWIDKQSPQITNITDEQYFNTNITPIIVDPNYSGATLNGSEYTGTEITDENNYTLFTEDILGNSTTIDFIIDKTAPTATIDYSNTGITNQDIVAIITGFSETITDLNSTGTTFTTNGTYTFTYQDLAGNLGVTIAEVTGIDKTPPTGTVEYSTILPTNGDVEVIITGFSEEITGLNQTGYIFAIDGTFLFTYQDLAGNTGESLATVTWIDKELPIFNGVTTGSSYGSEQIITFSDNKPGVLAILNGAGYTSGTPINGYGIFEFITTDTAGNTSGATFTLDTTTPIVTLDGSSSISLEVFTPYIEAGATRSDNGSSGPVTDIVGSVNTNILGTYTLDYFYTDTFHTGSVQRQVIIQDTTAPIITLNGDNPATIERTSAYTEDGAIWSDNYDGTGDVITILGSVNTDLAGTYILTYQKTDFSTNIGSTTRTVNVVDTIKPTASTITYSITGLTNQDVIASITGFSENITNLNTTSHTFTGNDSFTFTFEDLSGNTGELIATVTRIDKVPVTGYVEYVSSGLTNQDVIATMTGFNKTGVVVTSGANYTFTGNGTYTFAYTDLAGNTGETLANVTWIDKTAPTASTIEYSITGLTNQDVIATITGFSEIITGLNTANYTFTGNGSFAFTFQDLAGNTGELTAIVTRIDKTPITSSIIYVKSSLTNEDVIATITGFNKTGVNVIGGNIYTFTGNGTHLFQYQDLAGNTGESLAIVTWIDKEMPTASLRYDPLGPTWTNGSVFVQITGFSESITGLNQPDYLFLSNGTFLFTYRDLAGNTGTNIATVNRIDITPPTVGQAAISAGMTGNNGVPLYYNGTIDIRSTVSDAGGSTLDGTTCEYTINNGTTRSPAGFNTTYCQLTSLSPATNIQIAFRIKDTATNLTTGASRSYIFDNTAPITTATPNSGTSNTNIPVTLSRSDIGIGTFSGTRYCIDTTDTCTPNIAGTAATITGAANTLETKYLRYRSIDRLNNTEIIKSNVYTIDKVLPSITGTTSYSNNSTNTGYATTNNIITIGFSSTRTLGTLPTVTISGGSLTTGIVTDLGGNNYTASYTAKVTDTQGQTKFIVNVQDTLGNTGTAIINSVILDRTAPAGIAFTSPTAGTFWTSGQNYDIKRSTGTETNFGPISIKIIYSINSFFGYSTLENGTGNSGIYTRNNFNVDTDNLQIRIIATDLAGNQTTITSSTFGVDNTPPVAPTFINPIGGEFIKGGSGYLVTWTGGYDPDGNMASIQLEYSINNGTTYTSISTTIPTSSTSYIRTPSTALNSNTTKLRITYRDYAGLQGIRQTPTVFTLDGINPNVSNILSGKIYTGIITPTIVEANYSGSILTSGTGTTTYTTTGYSITQNGRYNLFVEDKAGNSTGRIFAIDTTAPTVQIDTGTIYKNTGFTLAATGIDTTAGISGYQRTKLSGTGNITFGSSTTGTTTISADTNGTYIIQVKAIDKVNLSGFATFTLIRNIDAPTLSSGTITTGTTTATFSFISNKTGTLLYSGACGNGTATTATNSGTTTTSWTLSNNTYSNCSIKVTDSFGNYSRINVPSFTINYTAPTGGGGGGGGGGGTTTVPTCNLSDLVCDDGEYIKKSGVSCQGGDLGDNCGETTSSTSTGTTAETSEDIISTASAETIAATLVGIQGVAELKKAYIYGKYLGLTNASTFEQANMNGVITRSSLAKMMSVFSIKILKKQPDTNKKCEFNDIANETQETQEYIKTACQLGIMGIDKNGNALISFFGTKTINRATFGTTLSRTLWGNKYNSNDTNWYQKHLEALQKNGIMKQVDKPENRELKGYIMLMMFRTDLQLISKVTIPENTTTSSTSSTNNNSETTTTQTTNNETIQNSQPDSTTTNTTQAQLTTQTDITRTDTEQAFIAKINKNYQFTVGFKRDAVDISIKYLQYFLKSQGFYQGVINGSNSESTINALFQWQKANNVLTDATDPAAGYLGPKTRDAINPLLKTLLNQ